MKTALVALGAGTLLASLVAGCWERDPAPRYPQLGPAGGYAPDDFDFEAACKGGWEYGTNDKEARKHLSFPETVPFGCYVPVRYEEGTDRIFGLGELPAGCGYPEADTKTKLLARARVYERIATGAVAKGDPVPLEIACGLPDRVRIETARANGRTLRSYADSIVDGGPVYPYAVAGTFGFGDSAQNESKLLAWQPATPCIELDGAQRGLLGVNNIRAARIAEAYRAGVAPLVTVSGGAVHGKLIEAYMLGHLAHCGGGVPIDRVLFDPCADHTHTNIRNTGAIIKGMSGRHAYLVTDDFLQSIYLQEWTAFELLGGSIDQRALRDWGHLIGAWRQASSGMPSGFWYTPYRFWAEPKEGRGSFSCVGDVPFEK